MCLHVEMNTMLLPFCTFDCFIYLFLLSTPQVRVKRAIYKKKLLKYSGTSLVELIFSIPRPINNLRYFFSCYLTSKNRRVGEKYLNNQISIIESFEVENLYKSKKIKWETRQLRYSKRFMLQCVTRTMHPGNVYSRPN